MWCPKYRRKVLINGIDARFREVLFGYAANIFCRPHGTKPGMREMPEVFRLQDERYITVTSNRKKIQIGISTILYVIMKRNDAEIHVAGNKIFTVRMTLKKLKEELGDGFLKVHRSCLVSVIAIHDIKDKVYLNNGEALDYVVRKKKALLEELKNKQKR